MTDSSNKSSEAASILIVDGDVVSRHAISDYLRHCGYNVVEAAGTSEAMIALKEPSLSLDVIVCDVEAIGNLAGSELENWVRKHRPELEVRMASTLENVAGTAVDLCKSGPHSTRNYGPEAVVSYITRLRAAAAGHQPTGS